jgi:serine/threonine protein kinase
VGDRYRVVQPLARGGFGAVYIAEQLTTERRVALKMLARYAEDVSVERLLSEARVTSRIVSDHIVQVIDAGVDSASGDVFVVMELLRGTTLDERVMDHGPLSARETAEYMRQIAVGLDKAHGHLDATGRPTPIIHRDLKPSNIFITRRDDGRPLLKILDFGAAKVLSQTTKASGVVRGTPQFMAPEQAMGQPSNVATDVWALGLIAFYLLTARSYWLTVERDGTEAQLFAEILNLPLVMSSERARQLGVAIELAPAFDAWFSRCVNREQAQRFSSAGLAAVELCHALGVVLEPHVSEVQQRPSAEKPLTPSLPRAGAPQLETPAMAAVSSTPRPGRANRRRAGLATLGLLLAGGGGAAAVVLWKQGRVGQTAPSSVTASRPASQGPGTSQTAAPAGKDVAAAGATSALSSASSSSPDRAAPSATAPRPPAAPTTKRGVPLGAKSPAKAASSPRDPYEQR